MYWVRRVVRNVSIGSRHSAEAFFFGHEYNSLTKELSFSGGTFDHIIFSDVLEHFIDPWSVLKKVAPLLRSGGSVIACIPNIGHISLIVELLSGQFRYVSRGLLDKTRLRFSQGRGLRTPSGNAAMR
jgi:2-polyprenyl-3-methyl-5-hydroxy-6-metoxy-1,4-benzoquinol methylase